MAHVVQVGGRRAVVSYLVVMLVATGCGARQPRSSETVPNRDVITAGEISRAAVSNALEAVQRLRPEFLRSRGATSLHDASSDYPDVYLDGIRLGALDELRTVQAHDIVDIRRLSAADATTLFGTNHAAGALLIRTRR